MTLIVPEVTLVAVGAALSFIAQVIAGRLMLTSQRKLAEDERIFEQRASIYVRLIKELSNVGTVSYIPLLGGPGPEEYEQYHRCYLEITDLRPSILAFSSPKIRIAFTEWFTNLDTTRKDLFYIVRFQSQEDTSEIAKAMSKIVEDAEWLIQEVTADLGISVPKATNKRSRIKPRRK